MGASIPPNVWLSLYQCAHRMYCDYELYYFDSNVFELNWIDGEGWLSHQLARA
jgi:hypothetical protein